MQVKSPSPAHTQALEESLQACPVLSILRLPAPADLSKAAESLQAGGIRVLEITLPTPGCLEAVSALRRRYAGAELRIGVGTVLSQEEASRAIGAGAEFLVTPVLDEATVRESIRHGVPILPGVFTPTEAWRAWTMGAPIVKLFPADSLSSSVVQAYRAPLPMLKILPTGGVTLVNVREWLQAGAVGVGVGSALARREMIEQGDWSSLTREARTWVEAARRDR
ncbi:MAG: bifunctional 4-hydroxy-2-oxoglutarate aldolase/2-dehydro-3-deoxy-phosphogluconate aldolase [Betaproteobacteria bacterium]|nr:bifunctional 4-hydroxy-2-oxoglutarate aldolase/2-dehydro-3-deoxy-phosphogluconate aldolase [Betaproteobacteria bacterium]NBQ65211.1 bifunctional 4-hydroxy-2-oxoglutarate aldolase/2-dehydro-3-deoxy-phosphogluconate aldolase [Verrucomicrobiota bacterium]NCY07727.1 bifunctional 4-hydroxy-2-oxoglutarate aldolase/2-dehydro-3-deoxy-phosphogluconate aldolase [Betaproteobacteria bacterium]NDC03568.1 bifunctional 4-hydroxy-2-oxoglutarate aldolase/2-dehydro-3-deoxy-phosphogluconate aldolase [Betaproteo